MSMHYVNMISNRLSLRKPQRESLEILQRICDISTLGKDVDLDELKKIVQSEFPHVQDFDRDFPSLCFALATGVGKTRLMGAFISYLYLKEGIRHFFVLAPNLTIYNKLIADFTPNTKKYVFKGIGEFAQNPPLIITGDNYETGKGVRGSDLFEEVHINIFNISKITARDKGKLSSDDEKTKVPRIRRLSEYIGESYFDYLSGLDDLVVLMDESHRYRADAGMSAINELKPILGLELTATPQVERGSKTEPFNNVIYSYPLSNAMIDGYVKEPAVATRENFVASNYSEEALEKIKLEDGVRIHQNTKVELEVFARNNSMPIVKPFMMVVAQNTDHANEIQKLVESKDFFDGRYAGKVITVHSNVKGEEKDDVIQQLLTVEDPKNPVEIVIHVNMLKEGWDVTNLYTIVPLRAANSRTLVEQSIGRGLRLPYGMRVNVPAVDRLTIVSHDKFQDIVDHANDPNSIIRKSVVLGKDIPVEGQKAVVVKSSFEEHFTLSNETSLKDSDQDKLKPSQEKPKESIFKTDEEKKIAAATFDVIREFETLKSSKELESKEVQDAIVKKVNELVAPAQASLALEEKISLPNVVKKATSLYRELSIDIPKIVVLPKGECVCRYEDFDLNTDSINLQPVSQDILIQHLQNHERHTLKSGKNVIEENKPEDYLVRGLIDFDDINYDDHAPLLYKLAGQVVAKLKSYLKNDEEIFNVLQIYQDTLVKLIHSQMQEHFVVTATEFEAHVTKGFHTLKTNNYTINADEDPRDFRTPIPEGMRNQIKSMLFSGFNKCLYPTQKFDSDSERRFAMILENDSSVTKWFKPAKGDLQIHYNNSQSYEPDFVVETETTKYLCEPKRANDIGDDLVQSKAKAAATWCAYATVHAKDLDGKSWKYLLIPHDQISEQMTMQGLEGKFLFS